MAVLAMAVLVMALPANADTPSDQPAPLRLVLTTTDGWRPVTNNLPPNVLHAFLHEESGARAHLVMLTAVSTSDDAPRTADDLIASWESQFVGTDPEVQVVHQGTRAIGTRQGVVSTLAFRDRVGIYVGIPWDAPDTPSQATDANEDQPVVTARAFFLLCEGPATLGDRLKTLCDHAVDALVEETP